MQWNNMDLETGKSLKIDSEFIRKFLITAIELMKYCTKSYSNYQYSLNILGDGNSLTLFE